MQVLSHLKNSLSADRQTEKILTSKSLLSTCMYLSMKSRMVSHSAVNVGRDRRGVRWWRNTLDRTVAALMRVSSMPVGSCGLIGSSSLASRGKRTLLKQDSHSGAISVCRSWTSNALWRYVMALIRTCTNKSCLYSHGNAVVTERFTFVALIVCFELHWLHWLYNAPAYRTINNHASAQAVSYQNLSIEAWVQSLASTCNICGQSGDRIGFLYVRGSLQN